MTAEVWLHPHESKFVAISDEARAFLQNLKIQIGDQFRVSGVAKRERRLLNADR
jgi:hypothetical protein